MNGKELKMTYQPITDNLIPSDYDNLANAKQFVTKLRDNKALNNCSKLKFLSKVAGISIPKDLSDYRITDVEMHNIFTTVLFGLRTALAIVSYMSTEQTDMVQAHDLHVNFNMYYQRVWIANAIMHGYGNLKPRWHFYQRLVSNFYKDGYAFSY